VSAFVPRWSFESEENGLSSRFRLCRFETDDLLSTRDQKVVPGELDRNRYSVPSRLVGSRSWFRADDDETVSVLLATSRSPGTGRSWEL